MLELELDAIEDVKISLLSNPDRIPFHFQQSILKVWKKAHTSFLSQTSIRIYAYNHKQFLKKGRLVIKLSFLFH